MMKMHALFAVAVAAVMVGLGAAAEPEVEFALVKGAIEVNGQPLDRGRIFFHQEDGQFLGCRTKEDGTFKIDRVPTAEYPVTIEGTVDGKPLPDRYSSDKRAVLTVTVVSGAGKNEFTFHLVVR